MAHDITTTEPTGALARLAATVSADEFDPPEARSGSIKGLATAAAAMKAAERMKNTTIFGQPVHDPGAPSDAEIDSLRIRIGRKLHGPDCQFLLHPFTRRLMWVRGEPADAARRLREVLAEPDGPRQIKEAFA
jgi:hypothetical protein